MALRDVLAARLSELMESRVTLRTQMQLAEKSGVGQSTIQRILARESSATIDSIEKLAQAFGVQPMDLLTQGERHGRIIGLWEQLSDTDKQRVLSFIEVAIESGRANSRQVAFSRARPLSSGAIAGIKHATSSPPQPDDQQTSERADATKTRGQKSRP